ncbi:unnamed protein product [Gadus morhua 'NCC']
MASLALQPLTLRTSSPTHSQPTPPKRHSQTPPTTVSPPSRTSTRECEWPLQVGCPIPVPANGITPLPPEAPTTPGPGICVPVPGAAARSLKA